MRLKIIIALLLPISIAAQTGKSVTVKTATGTATTTAGSGSANNVTSFGAVGDGSTNSAVAIQSALDAAHVKGGVVFFPSGTYVSNSKLFSYSNVTIKGEGYKSTTLKSGVADTLIVIRNAVNGTTTDYLSNELIKDITLDANNTGTVGLYVDGAANYLIEGTFFYKFSLKGLILKSSIVGTIRDCKFTGGQYGLYAYGGGGNVNASNLINVEGRCVFNFCTKWAMDVSAGGQFTVMDADCENNGTAGDSSTGVLNYHNNTWPGGLHWYRGWAEENNGTIINIDANSTNNYGNYPSTTTHSIEGFQDLGQQYSFTKRSVFLRGTNQSLGISNSSLTGSVNNIIADGAGVKVSLLNVTNDATPSNITRNAATITTK